MEKEQTSDADNTGNVSENNPDRPTSPIIPYPIEEILNLSVGDVRETSGALEEGNKDPDYDTYVPIAVQEVMCFSDESSDNVVPLTTEQSDQKAEHDLSVSLILGSDDEKTKSDPKECPSTPRKTTFLDALLDKPSPPKEDSKPSVFTEDFFKESLPSSDAEPDDSNIRSQRSCTDSESTLEHLKFLKQKEAAMKAKQNIETGVLRARPRPPEKGSNIQIKPINLRAPKPIGVVITDPRHPTPYYTKYRKLRTIGAQIPLEIYRRANLEYFWLEKVRNLRSRRLKLIREITRSKSEMQDIEIHLEKIGAPLDNEEKRLAAGIDSVPALTRAKPMKSADSGPVAKPARSADSGPVAKPTRSSDSAPVAKPVVTRRRSLIDDIIMSEINKSNSREPPTTVPEANQLDSQVVETSSGDMESTELTSRELNMLETNQKELVAVGMSNEKCKGSVTSGFDKSTPNKESSDMPETNQGSPAVVTGSVKSVDSITSELTEPAPREEPPTLLEKIPSISAAVGTINSEDMKTSDLAKPCLGTKPSNSAADETNNNNNMDTSELPKPQEKPPIVNALASEEDSTKMEMAFGTPMLPANTDLMPVNPFDSTNPIPPYMNPDLENYCSPDYATLAKYPASPSPDSLDDFILEGDEDDDDNDDVGFFDESDDPECLVSPASEMDTTEAPLMVVPEAKPLGDVDSTLIAVKHYFAKSSPDKQNAGAPPETMSGMMKSFFDSQNGKELVEVGQALNDDPETEQMSIKSGDLNLDFLTPAQLTIPDCCPKAPYNSPRGSVQTNAVPGPSVLDTFSKDRLVQCFLKPENDITGDFNRQGSDPPKASTDKGVEVDDKEVDVVKRSDVMKTPKKRKQPGLYTEGVVPIPFSDHADLIDRILGITTEVSGKEEEGVKKQPECDDMGTPTKRKKTEVAVSTEVSIGTDDAFKLPSNPCFAVRVKRHFSVPPKKRRQYGVEFFEIRTGAPVSNPVAKEVGITSREDTSSSEDSKKPLCETEDSKKSLCETEDSKKSLCETEDSKKSLCETKDDENLATKTVSEDSSEAEKDTSTNLEHMEVDVNAAETLRDTKEFIRDKDHTSTVYAKTASGDADEKDANKTSDEEMDANGNYTRTGDTKDGEKGTEKIGDIIVLEDKKAEDRNDEGDTKTGDPKDGEKDAKTGDTIILEDEKVDDRKDEMHTRKEDLKDCEKDSKTGDSKDGEKDSKKTGNTEYCEKDSNIGDTKDCEKDSKTGDTKHGEKDTKKTGDTKDCEKDSKTDEANKDEKYKKTEDTGKVEDSKKLYLELKTPVKDNTDENDLPDKENRKKESQSKLETNRITSPLTEMNCPVGKRPLSLSPSNLGEQKTKFRKTLHPSKSPC